MSEFRHMRSGSLNIQSPSGKDHSNHSSSSNNGSTMSPIPAASHGGAAGARFDGPRSPPNTSHVPCKFFRQGACQAGSACPFSHDLGSAAETVCKYFAKGNCKFGPKCANVHVLADGRRINYGKNGITIGQPVHVGSGRTNSSSSALTNSFMQADASAPYGINYSYAMSPSGKYSQLDHPQGLENGLPTIDTTYSHTNSQYGSPREEDASRLGLGLSPVVKGLSVLDAPLPASFDSNGISNAARFPAGPFPSSVPSQFGLESPSPSLNTAKEIRTSEALKLLHHSAFGSNEHLAAAAAANASSPPTQATDEYFGRRPMHSSRFAKPHLLSSSAPRATRGIDRDWEAEFPFLEEDYVPDNLKDLLTPAEKARRGSRAADEEVNGHNGRRIPNGVGFSGHGTPNAETTSKFSSPIGASPSRWGPLFQRQREDDDAKKHALAASAGAFGHVGSPLRNSTLNADLIRPHAGNRSDSVEGLSVLTQQLQRTRIDGTGGESPLLRPTSHTSRPTNGRSTERHVSSSSISSSARYTTPIGEEDGEFVFSMDDDGDSTIRARKRTSGVGTAMGVWGTSYAGVTSGAGKKEDGSSRVVDVGGGR
ncbi:hypothetical protein PG996_013560 [Apiospora saccharicola]|uniref:C3H1-type domain-containing protein n=1 Tax=Apiospora saccharicola TaxID=335842 RepID=A0ABR1U8J7_9PEZI